MENETLTEEWWGISKAVGFGLIFALGTLTVLPVLLLILLLKSLRTANSAIVFNLLLSGYVLLLGLPFLVTTLVLERWVFGSFLCPLVLGSEALGKVSVVVFVSIAAFERFLLVSKNLRLTNTLIFTICAVGWLISLCAAAPFANYSGLRKNGDCGLGFPSEEYRRNVVYLFFFLFFLFPIIVINYCYLKIIIVFNRSRRRLARYSLTSMDNSIRDSRGRRGTLLSGTRRRHQRRRSSVASSRNVTRMILLLISVFLIAWCPYWILNLAVALAPQKMASLMKNNVVYGLLNVIHMLPYFGSVLNPVLYVICTDRFQKAFRRRRGKELEKEALAPQGRNYRATAVTFILSRQVAFQLAVGVANESSQDNSLGTASIETEPKTT